MKKSWLYACPDISGEKCDHKAINMALFQQPLTLILVGFLGVCFDGGGGR